MKIKEETSRSGFAEAFRAVAEIQDSLNAIAIGDTTVKMLSQSLQGEQKPTEMHRREVLERIAVLNASIQRNKKRIHQLEANLKKAGLQVAGLQKMIDGLNQTLTEKQAMIASLGTQVDSLQTTVTGLQTTVQQGQDKIQQQDQTIESKRKEMATIYYIIGTKTELRKAGVTATHGGVLGMGKTLEPSASYNESAFTPLDTDQETVIRVPSARVEVLSAQPKSSYELKLVDKQTELHILAPAEFRKVKHLIVMTR